jgi:hypothetical protein
MRGRTHNFENFNTCGDHRRRRARCTSTRTCDDDGDAEEVAEKEKTAMARSRQEAACVEFRPDTACACRLRWTFRWSEIVVG